MSKSDNVGNGIPALHFVYIEVTDGYAGQAAAAVLAAELLERSGYKIVRSTLPHLNRGHHARLPLTKLAVNLLLAAKRLWKHSDRHYAGIYVALGQTCFGLLRDGIALRLAHLRAEGEPITVAALNGNLFSNWRPSGLRSRVFRWVTKPCEHVICLGPDQRRMLIGLGLKPEKICVIPNTCDYDAIDEKWIERKHTSIQGPVQILFLSTLYASKGYPEFLEALEGFRRVNQSETCEAVLCGPVVVSPFDDRFGSVAEAESWIQERIELINRRGEVAVKWIKGAKGQEKKALFEQAHVFVLPTHYAVEAQPLVLLEAMAHGCAIISTRIAEIPYTLGEECALLLAVPSSESIGKAIDLLLRDRDARLRLAQNASRRFKGEFSRHAHQAKWEAVFSH